MTYELIFCAAAVERRKQKLFGSSEVLSSSTQYSNKKLEVGSKMDCSFATTLERKTLLWK